MKINCIYFFYEHIFVSGSTDKHTKLEIDLIKITKYIYLTLTLCFNSHTLSLLHSSHASIQLSTGHLADHICFFVTMLALSCSHISLIRSFFCPWNISNTQITPHHSYTLTLATFILPYKHHVFSLIHGNHYHNFKFLYYHVRHYYYVFLSLRSI